MDCTEFLARYSDYDDSLLPAPELARFSAHLGMCSACARYDRVLRKGRMLARQIPAPRASGEFLPALEDRLTSASSGERPARRLAAGAMVGLAGLLAASSALWIATNVATGGAMDGATAEASTLADHGHAAAYESVPPTASAVGGRALTLPRVAWDDPADWSAARVDRRVAASYSPFVSGPPAYRSERAPTTGPTLSTRITLD